MASVATPPNGSQPVGVATKQFLGLPGQFSAWEYAGVAFIVWVIARHWGRFINDIS